MLWAMGKELPDGVATAEAAAQHVERKETEKGVEYWKVRPLQEGDQGVAEERRIVLFAGTTSDDEATDEEECEWEESKPDA